eukprot:CAMPEP_0179077868 /NCGR_PEP_ID=MMETSP0796-20121207/34834_1 /TAXON_ID=73915 /ORGANISM="Pyrodinium bahamense, Strain pbaha01" /LENGTH=195 /DNA_ID=CAMNT_0020775157 /DNA_START=52 /DNA_END=636 /DNA_ORIENTATION=+
MLAESQAMVHNNSFRGMHGGLRLEGCHRWDLLDLCLPDASLEDEERCRFRLCSAFLLAFSFASLSSEREGDEEDEDDGDGLRFLCAPRFPWRLVSGLEDPAFFAGAGLDEDDEAEAARLRAPLPLLPACGLEARPLRGDPRPGASSPESGFFRRRRSSDEQLGLLLPPARAAAPVPAPPSAAPATATAAAGALAA